MLKVLRSLAPPMVVLALIAAACSNSSSAAGGSQGGTQCNQDLKVGLALDVGGLGDKSFNDAAYTGLQNAIKDGVVCVENTKFLEANATGSNRGENITNLAEAGYQLIIGVGFAFSPDINEIAKDYPDESFAVIDGYATCGTACGLTNDADAIPNVADLTFTEQQGSFLVGAAAAPTRNDPCCSVNVRSATFGIASAPFVRPQAVPQVAYPSITAKFSSG